MQIVSAACERGSIEPNLSLFARTIPIGVGQFPNLRWSRDIDVAADAQDTFGKAQLLGNDLPLIESAIFVGISEPDDTMRARDELLLDGFFGFDVPNRLGNHQRTVRREGGNDGPSAKFVRRDLFDRAELGDRQWDLFDLDRFRFPGDRQSFLCKPDRIAKQADCG
jgi:hypothetical protein